MLKRVSNVLLITNEHRHIWKEKKSSNKLLNSLGKIGYDQGETAVLHQDYPPRDIKC